MRLRAWPADRPSGHREAPSGRLTSILFGLVRVAHAHRESVFLPCCSWLCLSPKKKPRFVAEACVQIVELWGRGLHRNLRLPSGWRIWVTLVPLEGFYTS